MGSTPSDLRGSGEDMNLRLDTSSYNHNLHRDRQHRQEKGMCVSCCSCACLTLSFGHRGCLC